MAEEARRSIGPVQRADRVASRSGDKFWRELASSLVGESAACAPLLAFLQNISTPWRYSHRGVELIIEQTAWYLTYVHVATIVPLRLYRLASCVFAEIQLARKREAWSPWKFITGGQAGGFSFCGTRLRDLEKVRRKLGYIVFCFRSVFATR